MSCSSPPSHPPRSRLRRRLVGTPGTLLLVPSLLLSLTACTGKDDKDTPSSAPGGKQSPPASAAVDVSVGRVYGDLRDQQKAALVEQVRSTLDEYVDDAFLGSYPRTDFDGAFATFTKGAAAQAEQDLDLVSAASYGDSDSVAATKAKASLRVFSPKGRPSGVTAFLTLRLDVDGAPAKYSGRLLLTPEKGGTWKIFGFDLKHHGQGTGADQ